MEEMADVNVMYELLKSGDEISAIEKLLNEFEAHESKEERSLEQYRGVTNAIKDPVNRFVLQMIVSDEEKHRAVVHAMAATLKGSLTWSKPAGSLEGDPDSVAASRKLLGVTEEFIKLEREGIKEYKSLLKVSEDYYHGLFKILISAMIHDSEKHVELLEFLHERLKAQ
jgi:bacterioferritin (cytochrome b1)